MCVTIHTTVTLAGSDATASFEEIGHSEDARSQLKEFYIGDLSPVCHPLTTSTTTRFISHVTTQEERVEAKPVKSPVPKPAAASSGSSATCAAWCDLHILMCTGSSLWWWV